MNAATRRALHAINREFYAAEASSASFSATRDHAWPGWARAWQRMRERRRATRAGEVGVGGPEPLAPRSPLPPLALLDLGCGNGRFAAFLCEAGELDVDYVGVDASPRLLEQASERARPLARAQLLCGDLLDEGARVDLDAALQPLLLTAESRPSFDAIVLFGVLHHIPGFETRVELLASCRDWLSPGGLLAVTLWRFGEPSLWPRFASRDIPWQAQAASASPSPDPCQLDPSQLEAGDHLLRWGEGGLPPRYCHYVDPQERDALVEALAPSLQLIERYTEDGRGNDLNEYLLLRSASET